MKLKHLLRFAILFLFISDIGYAASRDQYPNRRDEDNDTSRLSLGKLNDCHIYASIDDKGVDTDQNDSNNVAIKKPDNVSPYLEIGLSKKY